jgi:hypothetical protein
MQSTVPFHFRKTIVRSRVSTIVLSTEAIKVSHSKARAICLIEVLQSQAILIRTPMVVPSVVPGSVPIEASPSIARCLAMSTYCIPGLIPHSPSETPIIMPTGKSPTRVAPRTGPRNRPLFLSVPLLVAPLDNTGKEWRGTHSHTGLQEGRDPSAHTSSVNQAI